MQTVGSCGNTVTWENKLNALHLRLGNNICKGLKKTYVSPEFYI